MVCPCRRQLRGTHLQQVTVAPSVTGRWSDTANPNNISATLLEMPDGSISGTWIGTNRPAFTGLRTGNSLVLNFPDALTYSGTLPQNGGTIHWDTSSTWGRWAPPLTGIWLDNSLSLVENPDGSLVGHWLNTSRPDLHGIRSLNSVTMTFPGNLSLTGAVKSGTLEIIWDSPTPSSWYRSATSPDVTGKWYDPTDVSSSIVTLVQTGTVITGSWDNGQPPFSGVRTGNTISVNFPGSPPQDATVWFCGVRLNWDSGKYWIRVPTVWGKWNNNEVQLAEGDNGQIIGKWLNGTQPNFSGTQTGNTVTLNFPNQGASQGVVSINDSTIQWGTFGSTWTRSGW